MTTITNFHNPIHTPWWFGSGTAPSNLVPWVMPCAINDHPYVMDFKKTRITTLQVRRQSADDSVEPGESTLSIGGVWPRGQDNWFLGVGQEYLDNRFSFETVYVHSGEYPSVRTRSWKSCGIDVWKESKLSLLPEYAVFNESTSGLVIVACGDYLYASSGQVLTWFYQPVGDPDPSPTVIDLDATTPIVSLTTDGSRVWAATGADGVFVTEAGSLTSTPAATPAALNGVGGLNAEVAAAGTVDDTNLPNGSVTYYVSEVDAFGNETAAVAVTATVAGTPINLTWNPDPNASDFNVYRLATGLSEVLVTNTSGVPSFVDDGTIAGTLNGHPTTNATGSTAYPATFVLYAKGHLIGSTGRDLVEILANGNVTFIYQHENPDFVFTCGCEVPVAILVGGYAGGGGAGQSFIGAIQPDTTNDGATLAPPTWASTLSPGENINAMAYDAGAVLLATSLGIRSTGPVASDGSFDVNPVIEDPGNCLCLAPYSEFEYFGWSAYDSTEVWAPNRELMSGLGRADQSQYTNPGIPAYAPDVMVNIEGSTTSVVIMGAGVPYFVVDDGEGDQYLCGPTGNVVESGWIEPGWVRYGTLEEKIVVEVDFQHEPLPVGASVQYQIVAEDMTSVTDAGTNAVAGSTTVETPLSAGLIVGDRFMPIITLNASSDQSEGPVFLSHITKAMVVTRRQDEVLLGIVFHEKAYGLGQSQKRRSFNLLEEWNYLKNLEGTGVVVALTMGSITRQAYIDQIMFEPDQITSERDFFQGSLVCKLITLD